VSVRRGRDGRVCEDACALWWVGGLGLVARAHLERQGRSRHRASSTGTRKKVRRSKCLRSAFIVPQRTRKHTSTVYTSLPASTNKASRRWAGLWFERYVTFLICLPFTFFGSFSRQAAKHVLCGRTQTPIDLLLRAPLFGHGPAFHLSYIGGAFFAFAMSLWCFRPLALRPSAKGSTRFTCPWTRFSKRGTTQRKSERARLKKISFHSPIAN